MATNQQVVGRVGVQPRQSSGVWRDAFGRLRKNRLALLGLFGIMLPRLHRDLRADDHALAVLRAGHRRRDRQRLQADRAVHGSAAHILGTDQLGQDMLSRLLDGARISLTVAIVVQFVVIGIGVPIGAIAGWYSGSRIDNGLMRFTDVMYAFPDLLLIILFSVAFRETAFGQALNGLLLVFVAIGLVSWVTVARLVRGQFLSLKETEFVEAAQAIGVSDRNIIMKHLLPNGISPIIVAITLGIPAAILAEAALAYIGVGVQPPRASWGSLIAAGQPFIRSYPHLTYMPGILIALALISFTFLGDGLRDALDPKLKGKQ